MQLEINVLIVLNSFQNIQTTPTAVPFEPIVAVRDGLKFK
jgi:hypothetical protein